MNARDGRPLCRRGQHRAVQPYRLWFYIYYMRLTNVDDQAVVKRLLPDSLGDYAEMLPILDVGEALVVGDASLLPSRIKITRPTLKPRSATVDFWDEWARDKVDVDIASAIESLRKQAK